MKNILVLFTLFVSFSVTGQVETGTIRGVVYDENDDTSTVPFANVTLLQDNKQITGIITDFDGVFVLKNIKPGEYSLQVSFDGYQKNTYHGVAISANKITILDAKLSNKETIESPIIWRCCLPSYIMKIETSGDTYTREEIQRHASF